MFHLYVSLFSPVSREVCWRKLTIWGWWLGIFSFLKRKDCRWNRLICFIVNLRVRSFFLSFFLFFPLLTTLLVIGSDKYRREMLERGETFLTNLEHQKEVCPFLLFYSKERARIPLITFCFFLRRFIMISPTLKKNLKVYRYIYDIWKKYGYQLFYTLHVT